MLNILPTVKKTNSFFAPCRSFYTSAVDIIYMHLAPTSRPSALRDWVRLSGFPGASSLSPPTGKWSTESCCSSSSCPVSVVGLNLLFIIHHLQNLTHWFDCFKLFSVLSVGSSGCVSSTGSLIVTVSQSFHQAEENDNITLEWSFTTRTNSSPSLLSVFCDLIADQELSVLYRVQDGVEVSELQDKRFAGRVWSDSDALAEGRIALQLSGLTTHDSGLYVCKASTDHGDGSDSCRLNVTGKSVQ